jgi:BirA family biotin operon repressor/biotin-[acetyl-CoA-carboxylase] ligase
MNENFFDYYFYKSLENTNDKIKKINLSKKKNLALFTNVQKKGRGRNGKIWVSYEGDLTCSFLINKKLKINEIGRINILIASALIDILEKIGLKEAINFKWPNDIFVNERKIAGVLIETNISKEKIQNFTIGIGVNFISKSIDEKNSAISINNLKLKTDPINIFFMISNHLFLYINNYSKLDFDNLSSNLSKYFLYANRPVCVNNAGNKVKGDFVKINSYGKLILRNNSKNLEISFGDIF